ncbi:hypothetical protein SUGI_0241900 [Cryptomeria japonica]|uniref:L-ascorbate oxidase homolog n=1 Tax=Cryptomeria japonica TaxID=3369 RepID=UPI002408ADC9|nr:L-ascorbate oxidase homolog [Cryptomeria japonica]GLJ14868.1 hypothetical protein SUGI_0241900 [Cryptomeria japonica]
MELFQQTMMLFILFLVLVLVHCENPYRFFTWNVSYGTIWPLGVPQEGILINGQFPGPQIDSVTNDNLVINVFNNLRQPFLITWNGVQHRKNSWEDGVLGTNCPIPPGKNFTYKFQVKDQIGSYYYFPSTLFHKAAGGFGGLTIASRPLIPVPYPPPDGEYTLLIGDWYKRNHSELRRRLDKGIPLGIPDGVQINGLGGSSRPSFNVDGGKTYRLRISNVGLSTSLNFRIQGHNLTLVEVEGSHTVQSTYDSLDIHVGQSYTVLITTNQPPKDYYIVASTRFVKPVHAGIGLLHYSNSNQSASGRFPPGPPRRIEWSLNQARTIRWNLTASAARPNPQGSYHYGSINVTRTIILSNSEVQIDNKQRYAINGVSYAQPDTPLKLADFYNISGVFALNSIPDHPTKGIQLQTAVMSGDYKTFVEIVFTNHEKTIQSWHLDGYSFFVVGMDRGRWSPASRKSYNLFDAVYRCTVQVYPRSWTAILTSLDNAGMWNIRSASWERQYLGQQFYLRIFGGYNPRDEYSVPLNALKCGKAKGYHTSGQRTTLTDEWSSTM